MSNHQGNHHNNHAISNLLLTGMILSVAAGGLISWLSWSDDFSASKARKSLTVSAGLASEENSRSPSSINKVFTQSISSVTKTKAIDQLIKYDLNCNPQNVGPTGPGNQGQLPQFQNAQIQNSPSFRKLIVRGGFVQLHGKACLKLKNKSSPVVITNLTNGFQGSYFQAGQGRYKTDLIQLNEGENQIQVEFQNPSGKKSDVSFLVISHRI